MATSSTASEVNRRTGARHVRAPRTPFGALALVAEREADRAALSARGWPSAKYRQDPVSFFRTELGVEPWSRQVEIIEAVRDHKRVAVSSGHKCSKSHTAAGIAHWFFASFDDARVVMSSTTSRQVDQILWREFRMMHARAGRCLACKTSAPAGPSPCPHTTPIVGDLHELARSGMKADDFREVVGFTAREAEAVAGISGKNLLYILDEASGIPDAIFEAIEGNRAGGARIVMFSNPTRTEGEFFEAFHSKAAFYKTIQLSSEDSPNVIEGREVIPGLATREWVEEKQQEWGVDSPLYKIRVRGQFVLNETGKILSVHAIGAAEQRWFDAPCTGRLYVGLDPAGPGNAGDESAMAPRRGAKILELRAFRGLDDAGHLRELLALLAEHRKPREAAPVVVVDREGPIGYALFIFLRAYAEKHPEAFEVWGIRSSERAKRQPEIYERVRDELWANFAAWVRDGGAIPEDAKLSRELHAPEWEGQVTGRIKATSKDDLRKALGRSPDRADAVCLSTWESEAHGIQVSAPAREERDPVYEPVERIDCYHLDGVAR